jgi:hypothetical protein
VHRLSHHPQPGRHRRERQPHRHTAAATSRHPDSPSTQAPPATLPPRQAHARPDRVSRATATAGAPRWVTRSRSPNLHSCPRAPQTSLQSDGSAFAGRGPALLCIGADGRLGTGLAVHTTGSGVDAFGQRRVDMDRAA